MTSVKKIYIDVETTGVDPKSNGIIQLAGIVEIDDKAEEEFDYKIRPFPGDIILDSALVVSGAKREDIERFKLPLDVYVAFKSMLATYVDKYDKLDKFHFIGYNSRFDDSFLREWFKKNRDDYYGSYFWWPAIDVSNMAAEHFIETRKDFLDFKLMTVAKACGIGVDKSKAHDGLYDVKITRQLYKHLKERG